MHASFDTGRRRVSFFPVTLSQEEDIPLSSGLVSESRRRGRFRRDGDEGIPVVQPVTHYRMDWAHSAPH